MPFVSVRAKLVRVFSTPLSSVEMLPFIGMSAALTTGQKRGFD
jgi:hypothetical protein